MIDNGTATVLPWNCLEKSKNSFHEVKYLYTERSTGATEISKKSSGFTEKNSELQSFKLTV